MVNNLILVRLQNALANAFLPLWKAINPSGTGLFLTQGRQCGQVFWRLELHYAE